jgi:hypothetical protein
MSGCTRCDRTVECLRCKRKCELWPYQFVHDRVGNLWVQGNCCSCGTYYEKLVRRR